MAKNRKSQSAELRFGPALKALLICFFIGGAGIGYVHQKILLNKLGKEQKQLELELDRLEFSNSRQEQQLMQLNSQRLLQRRVEELGLNLRLPSPSQIVVVVDGAPQALAPMRMAGRAEGGSHLARGEDDEAHRP
jgi:hypothetical protein